MYVRHDRAIGLCPRSKISIRKAIYCLQWLFFPKDGRLIMTKPEWFKYDTVIASIREFLSLIELKANQILHLVLDNAPWHKKAIRLIEDLNNTEYADIRAKVRFIRAPISNNPALTSAFLLNSNQIFKEHLRSQVQG